MQFCFASMTSRLLLAATVVGGICFSGFFSAPVAAATAIPVGNGIAHEYSMVMVGTHGNVPHLHRDVRVRCCVEARMGSASWTSTSSREKTFLDFCIASLSPEAGAWQFLTRDVGAGVLLGGSHAHPPSSLVGITGKRE